MIESNAGNGTGGVPPDARKFQQPGDLFRKLSSVFIADHFCGFSDISDSPVVPQTFPKFDQQFLIRLSHFTDSRQGFHPPLVKGQHCFDLGLLKHDF